MLLTVFEVQTANTKPVSYIFAFDFFNSLKFVGLYRYTSKNVAVIIIITTIIIIIITITIIIALIIIV